MNDDLIKSDNWKTSDTKALISELRNSLSVQALPASGIGKSILESYIKGFTSSTGKWDTSSLVSAAALSGNIAKQSIEISSAAGIAHLVNEELTKSISSSFNTESANTFEKFFPPNEDYVTLDKDSIETFESLSRVIPLGKYRVKMSTDVFISIISLLVSIILSTSIALYQSSQGPTKSETQQIQLDETQNALLQTQNQLLYDLLHSIDTSSSSESGSLQSLKKAVEEQNLHLSRIEKSLDSIEKSLDNNASSGNTESEKIILIMRNPICVSKNAILKFLTCLRSFWISSLFSSISRLLSCFLSHLVFLVSLCYNFPNQI